MKVSVIIPVFNRERTIARAIHSALRQGREDLEVVVVDDGSTDGTAATVSRVEDPRVRYVRGPHGGVSAARNLGASVARGELLSFLDSDDEWLPGKTDEDLGFLAAHPELDAVFTDVETVHGSRTVRSLARQSPAFRRLLRERGDCDAHAFTQRQMYLCLLQEVPVKPTALTVRRSAFERSGGFRVSWRSSEDWEYLLRFSRTRRFGYIDQPLARLYISPDSLHLVRQVEGERAMLRLLATERARLSHDVEARAAVHEGLVQRVRHFAWYYSDAGHRLAAARVYLHGSLLVRDLGLLARAAAILVPGLMVCGRPVGDPAGSAA